MIYDRNKIEIPILCPLQFVEPKEYNIYTAQTDFLLYLKTGNLKICVLISDEVYNSGSNMTLKMVSENDIVLKTVNFTKKELSSDYYYATATMADFAEAGVDGLVYFEIYDGNSLLANSLWYLANPSVDNYIKTLTYTHNVNEWENIFVEDNDSINIPVNTLYQTYFDSVALTITETKYKLTFTLYDDGDPMTMLSPLDFSVYYNDISIGNVHTEEVSLDGTEATYDVEVDREVLEGSEISILCMTTIDNDIIFETEFMFLGDSFTAQNTFAIDVDCGIIPKDLRDEQEIEDFIQQDMVNETIYGETYGVESYTFGSSKGIPFYLAQKINRASLCDDFFINNVRKLRIKGAKLEKTDDTENGLGVYKIDFQSENTYLQ